MKSYADNGNLISVKYKKRINAKIKLNSNKNLIKSKIRITGDYWDHIDKNLVMSSLYVKLNEENISGITKFKLLLPKSRNSLNEVFAAVLMEKLGFLSPYTKNSKIEYNTVDNNSSQYLTNIIV